MDTKTPKTFWERPEGKLGKFMLPLLGLGGCFILYTLLPKIIILLQNTLYAGFLAVGLAAFIYVLLDPRVRNRSIKWFYSISAQSLLG